MGRNYTNYSKPQNDQHNSVVTVQSSDKDEEVLNNTQDENIEALNNQVNEATINGDLIEANISNNEEIVEKQNGIVICNMLYLRNGASLKDDVLAVLDRNQKVEIIVKESTNDFYRVHVNDLDGYCMKKFIKIR